MKGKIKMKLYKSKKDSDLFYYFNKKNEKFWCYRYRYYDALGNRKEKSKQGFKKENDAFRALLEVKTSIINGDTKFIENSNMTVSEWIDIWFETHKNDWKETTRKRKENVIKNHIKPLLGTYKLSNLDKTTYKREFINKLSESHSPGSVRLFHQHFRTIINAAVDNEIIPRNRLTKISIPNDNESINENFLTPEELRMFLKTAKEYEPIHYYTLILLLAFTGLRRGEALGLYWGNIDFDSKTVTVERTRDNNSIRTPKTKNSYRTILMDDKVTEQLKHYHNWCKQIMFQNGKHLKQDDFIFISQYASPLSDDVVTYAVDRISKKAKIKRITPHGLRHSHATILMRERIPIKIIADRLGNTPKTILSVYGHSLKEMESEAVLAFLKAIGE